MVVPASALEKGETDEKIDNINPVQKEQINSVQSALDAIYRAEGLEIGLDNVIAFERDVDGAILIVEVDGNVMSFNFSNNTQMTFSDNGQMISPRSGLLAALWATIKIVYKAQGIIGEIITGTTLLCVVVKHGTGDDICKKIGAAFLKSLVPNVQYKVTLTRVKDPGCTPSYSEMCNREPYAYWKTVAVKV